MTINHLHTAHAIKVALLFFTCLPASRPLSSQRDYLLGKLRELEGRLADSKGQRHATMREKNLAAAAARLKKELTGEHHWLQLQLAQTPAC